MEKTIASKIREIQGRHNSLTAKVVLSVLCLICFPFHIGFYEGCHWWNPLLYSFCHVNIFHLAINLIVLWNIKNKLRPVQSLVIAIVASFLPMYVTAPTMGLSAFLFSAMGLMWGKTGRWKDAIKKAMPFIVCTMIMPNANGLLHLYSFLIGFVVQYIITKAAAHHE